MTDSINSATRRKLARHGLRAERSRSRNPDSYQFGGYIIVDTAIPCIVAGGWPLLYAMSADDVRAYAADLDAPA